MLASITSNTPGRSSSLDRLLRSAWRPRWWSSSRIGATLEPGPHLLDRRLQRGAVEPARLPLLEHQLRRAQAERVVDRRAAADAHALEHLQAEVRRELERALVVEAQVLGDLVVVEVARVDVRAALEHEHLAAGLGEAVGEDPARRAGADHDRVVAPARRLGQRLQRRLDRVVRQRRPAAGPARVGRVADRVPRAPVAVVAEVGHLGAGADQRLHERPQRLEHAPLGDLVDEALLQELPARVGGERRAAAGARSAAATGRGRSARACTRPLPVDSRSAR